MRCIIVSTKDMRRRECYLWFDIGVLGEREALSRFNGDSDRLRTVFTNEFRIFIVEVEFIVKLTRSTI